MGSGVMRFKNLTNSSCVQLTAAYQVLLMPVLLTGGCQVMKSAEDSLQTTASLLGVDKEELRDSLTSRIMQATRGGTKGTAIK